MPVLTRLHGDGQLQLAPAAALGVSAHGDEAGVDQLAQQPFRRALAGADPVLHLG